MTCPSLLRRRPEAAEILGDASDRSTSRGPEVVPVLAERLRRDDVWAQFVRFVLVGGSSTAVYAALFLALRGIGYLPAHVSRPWSRRCWPTSCTAG